MTLRTPKPKPKPEPEPEREPTHNPQSQSQPTLQSVCSVPVLVSVSGQSYARPSLSSPNARPIPVLVRAFAPVPGGTQPHLSRSPIPRCLWFQSRADAPPLPSTDIPSTDTTSTTAPAAPTAARRLGCVRLPTPPSDLLAYLLIYLLACHFVLALLAGRCTHLPHSRVAEARADL